MRELKFRAWDSEGHEMSDPMTMRQLLTYSPLDEESADNLDNLMVMQFTGLQDANGVEIYEGDIVRHKSGTVTSVAFDFGCFGINSKNGLLPLRIRNAIQEVTVIGNIHENPELVNT